ncbi:MGDG synthase family glycosyltransferase [Bacillus xiapuensis]|uniref:MGDG synthase family glycosyltransferase n=1 Tax=Bacillus xiapuensis TaxID=2014075 RepID=UPI000C2501D7|nr:hypothetical protein [Bacillus xiapuensis]
MKILLLPLFRMPSGHHKAAEAIVGHLSNIEEEAEVKTIDFLSHFHSTLEAVISNIYLKWISRRPESYSKFYNTFMYSKKVKDKRLPSLCFWHKYFEWRLANYIKQENPDFIICTHCYPSKLLNSLKQKGKVNVPVVNVYTDFFLNDVWGKEHIDYHFVPHQEAKEQLIKQYGLESKQIFVTGIPVHPSFYEQQDNPKDRYILIAGGNSGLGHLTSLLERLAAEPGHYSYKVLCGNNKKLYNWILTLQQDKIEPIGYTSCRKKMNQYYEEAAAIVTKPGGITITEVLEKSLPIFILGALPGQEEINMRYLKKHQLIYELNLQKPIEAQIRQVIDNEMEKNKWLKRLLCYQLEKDSSIESSLLSMLEDNESSYVSANRKSAPI